MGHQRKLGLYGKNRIFWPKAEILGPKKGIHFFPLTMFDIDKISNRFKFGISNRARVFPNPKTFVNLKNSAFLGQKQCFLVKLINYLPSLTSSTFSSKDHRFSFPKEFLLLISILLHLLIFLFPSLCIFKSCHFFFCI